MTGWAAPMDSCAYVYFPGTDITGTPLSNRTLLSGTAKCAVGGCKQTTAVLISTRWDNAFAEPLECLPFLAHFRTIAFGMTILASRG
jgi:hypothetical protein